MNDHIKTYRQSNSGNQGGNAIFDWMGHWLIVSGPRIIPVGSI